MEAWAAKLICLVSLLTDCLIFGFIPRIIIPPPRRPGQSYRDYVRDSRKWYHVSKKYRRMFVSLVGTFGGGVFLATCLLDLLVDVTEDFEEFFKQVVQFLQPRGRSRISPARGSTFFLVFPFLSTSFEFSQDYIFQKQTFKNDKVLF